MPEDRADVLPGLFVKVVLAEHGGDTTELARRERLTSLIIRYLDRGEQTLFRVGFKPDDFALVGLPIIGVMGGSRDKVKNATIEVFHHGLDDLGRNFEPLILGTGTEPRAVREQVLPEHVCAETLGAVLGGRGDKYIWHTDSHRGREPVAQGA